MNSFSFSDCNSKRNYAFSLAFYHELLFESCVIFDGQGACIDTIFDTKHLAALYSSRYCYYKDDFKKLINQAIKTKTDYESKSKTQHKAMNPTQILSESP